MSFETIAVPFQTAPNGQQYLTELQLAEIPELQDFINRFPHCFERDPLAEIWWFYRYGKKDRPDHRA